MKSPYLNPRRIEFLITNLCNGKCIHCYATKQEPNYPKHINPALSVEIIEKVTSKYNVESVMTFGGEPMLFPKIVYMIHKTATRNKVSKRELITNGYWSNNKQNTKEIAEKLAKSGVNDIYFSIDAFHQEHIPLNYVVDSITACNEYGIENLVLNPCWLVSEKDDNIYNKRTKEILGGLESLPVRVSEGNIVEPSGEAVKNLLEFLPEKSKYPFGMCGDFPYTEPLDRLTSVSVEPDSRISVCNDIYVGYASKTDILDLIAFYNPFKVRETREIVEKGVNGLLSFAKSRGVEPDPSGYYSPCQMCSDLRRKLPRNLSV
jgi:organic radical activating enzyme